MESSTNEIFVVYEPGHSGDACLRFESGMTILCLDFLAEHELKKKNVPCISLRELVIPENTEEEWWVLTHDIAREWYRLPAMKFFEYDGIPIAEAPEPILQEYLGRLLYYVRIYLALKKTYPNARLHIPTPPSKDAPNAYYLASFIPWAVVDAARMAGLQSIVDGRRGIPEMYSFPRISWKFLFLRAYNMIIGCIPRRGFKIYTSEYWTHFVPIAQYLDDTEFILMESRKLFDISWREIVKHRIRIMRSHDVISYFEEWKVRRIAEQYKKEWKGAKEDVVTYLAHARAGLNWSPVLEACESMVMYAPRVIADIRTLQRIMKKERPNIVLQMASVGGPQHYFFLMARVAAQLKIPSIELQHAGATIDPRSVFSRIETDHLATYGRDVNAWHERIGHASDRLIPVGSPRFDRYVNERAEGIEKGKQLFAELGLDPARPVLLVILPFSDTLVTALDSYQLAEFFEMVHAVQNKNPGLQVLFKCRTGRDIGMVRKYTQELFPDNSAMAGNEDIFALLCASDAVVCNNSTVIYQAVLAQKPLVLCSWKSFDTYHARMYASAAPIVRTKEELVRVFTRIFTDISYREDLLNYQKSFLERYSFDGKSSKRVATLLRDLSQKSQ